VLLGTGGTAALIATQVINSLGGTALDLSANGASASNPNMLSGVLAVGNAICGAKTTMVEGLQFVTTGALSGTALVYRKAEMLKYAPAVPGNWVVQPTTVQAALDMIAAKIGPV
jgi:heme oxygenase